MLAIFRYDSEAAAGPMGYASSALRTCKEARSTSEYTATEGMPNSRQARITLTAISPRFAIRIFLNMLSTVLNKKPLRAGGASTRERAALLIGGLIERNPLRSGLFFRLRLLGGHGFVNPFVGGLEISCALRRIVTLDVCLFAVHQVHVSHGVIVIGTQLE